MDLGSYSRLFVLELISAKEKDGGVTLRELTTSLKLRPEFKVDIGRGATVKDFVDVMIKEGILTQNKAGKILPTEVGERLTFTLGTKAYYRTITRIFLENFYYPYPNR